MWVKGRIRVVTFSLFPAAFLCTHCCFPLSPSPESVTAAASLACLVMLSVYYAQTGGVLSIFSLDALRPPTIPFLSPSDLFFILRHILLFPQFYLLVFHYSLQPTWISSSPPTPSTRTKFNVRRRILMRQKEWMNKTVELMGTVTAPEGPTLLMYNAGWAFKSRYSLAHC